MSFLNLLTVVTRPFVQTVTGVSRIITKVMRPVAAKKRSYYPTMSKKSDEAKISGDFRAIGNDLFKVLNNYEQKHRHPLTNRW